MDTPLSISMRIERDSSLLKLEWQTKVVPRLWRPWKAFFIFWTCLKRIKRRD